MSVRRTAVAWLILLALAGCGSETKADPAAGEASTPPGSTQPTIPAGDQSSPATKAPIREKVVVDAQGGGAGKGLCTLFTAAELSGRLGFELGDGVIAAPLDSGCQWTGTVERGRVMIQRTGDDFWSVPKGQKGYKALTGIGDKAYAAPGMFKDWTAAALHGKYMTIVSVKGPDAGAAKAAELLKETLTRG